MYFKDKLLTENNNNNNLSSTLKDKITENCFSFFPPYLYVVDVIVSIFHFEPWYTHSWFHFLDLIWGLPEDACPLSVYRLHWYYSWWRSYNCVSLTGLSLKVGDHVYFQQPDEETSKYPNLCKTCKTLYSYILCSNGHLEGYLYATLTGSHIEWLTIWS